MPAGQLWANPITNWKHLWFQWEYRLCWVIKGEMVKNDTGNHQTAYHSPLNNTTVKIKQSSQSKCVSAILMHYSNMMNRKPTYYQSRRQCRLKICLHRDTVWCWIRGSFVYPDNSHNYGSTSVSSQRCNMSSVPSLLVPHRLIGHHHIHLKRKTTYMY